MSRSEASRIRNTRRAAKMARLRNSSTRWAVCKRCGQLGHFSKTCPYPKVAGGRPDVERIIERIVSGRNKRLDGQKVIEIVRYLRRVEAQRAQLITLVREQLSTRR